MRILIVISKVAQTIYTIGENDQAAEPVIKPYRSFQKWSPEVMRKRTVKAMEYLLSIQARNVFTRADAKCQYHKFTVPENAKVKGLASKAYLKPLLTVVSDHFANDRNRKKTPCSEKKVGIMNSMDPISIRQTYKGVP